MKTLIFIFILSMLAFNIHGQENSGFYLVINGEPATTEEFDEATRDTTAVMHFLPSAKAIRLFGPIAKNGAIMLTTNPIPDSSYSPIMIMNGRRTHPDSLNNKRFEYIDVIRGPRATSLYGPTGKDGVFIVHPSEEPPLQTIILHLTNSKGKAVKKAKVISENDRILAMSDSCGWIVLENFSLGNTVTISTGKKSLKNLVINNQYMNVKL